MTTISKNAQKPKTVPFHTEARFMAFDNPSLIVVPYAALSNGYYLCRKEGSGNTIQLKPEEMTYLQ
jgi:hypothetical protein